MKRTAHTFGFLSNLHNLFFSLAYLCKLPDWLYYMTYILDKAMLLSPLAIKLLSESDLTTFRSTISYFNVIFSLTEGNFVV